MAASRRIVKINEYSYITALLRGYAEATLKKGSTYIHHSLHMFADGSGVRFRGHS